MKWWKYLILILVLVAVMPFVLADDWKNLYTQNASFITMHCMNGNGIWNWSGNNDTLNYLMNFDDIWVSNSYPLNETWVDNLHTYGGKRRRIFFHERFPYLHFTNGYENPASYEGWKTSFLDDHLSDYFLVHARYSPNYTVFAEGKWCDDCNWYDYFFNYGNGDADNNLTHQYYDVKRADWNYDGIFLDLTGSFWIGEERGQAVIKDVHNESKEWNVLKRYNLASYAAKRDNATMTYDENGRAFLEKLRAKNTSKTDFPIWTNQAYKSGNYTTDENEYYKIINADIMESEFVGWINNDGNKEGVSVMLDGVWYNDSNPVESLIIPFWEGRDNIKPMIDQAVYSKNNYGNTVPGRIFNNLRPYYDPIDGGYNATVDREAIYYSYGVGKVLRIKSYARDVKDTVRNRTGVDSMPEYTGLPKVGYHKWAKDDIYFLDLGDYEPGSYEVYNVTGTRQVVVRWFEKGFVILNTGPEPTKNCCINFTQYSTPYLKNQTDGTYWYYNNFEDSMQTSTNQKFCIPAGDRPLENTTVNSARVYSYLNSTGQLIEI